MPQQIVIIPNYKPHAKQVLLHNAPLATDGISITLFGGARGAGKSGGILGDAFMFCQTYPGAKAIIIRESLGSVRQSFLDKLPSLFPQEMQGHKLYDYKENSSSFYPGRSIVFPNGSYITFQRVANYQEAKAFQGFEFQYLAVDEITKHDQKTIEYLLTIVRSPLLTNKYTGKQYQIPTKVVFGANPGGKGHKWVKKMFIDPTVTSYDPIHNTPLTTKDHKYNMVLPGEDGRAEQKIPVNVRFIPASYKDNPYIAKSYVAMLLMQPEHMQEMDIWGNWDVVAGKMFDLKEKQRLAALQTRQALKEIEESNMDYEIFISVDWGYKPSYHSAHWHIVTQDKRVLTFQEQYGQELIFEDFVKVLANRSEGMYISATCLPHDMFRSGDRYRDEGGKVIGETKSDVFEHWGLNPVSVLSGKGNVEMRNDKIHSSTTIVGEDNVHKFRISELCPNLIEEFDEAVHDEFYPLKIAEGCRDHALDDYGLFLIYYSDELAPIGSDTIIVKDNRPKLIRLVEKELEELEADAEDNYSIALDNIFDL